MSEQKTIGYTPPILIVGHPRSGTTWLANLLNSHPDVAYRHEIIGRSYRLFGAKLFEKLKHCDNLSGEDRDRIRTLLYKARVETDRPPFFEKSYHRVGTRALKKFLWSGTNLLPQLNKLYEALYTPSPRSNVRLVIKETRSTIDMKTIIKNIEPQPVIFLYRHPYAVIASVLEGIDSQGMGGDDTEYRRNWYNGHRDSEFVVDSGITQDDIAKLEQIAFLEKRARLRRQRTGARYS